MEDAKQRYEEVFGQSHTWEELTCRTVDASASVTGSIELHLPTTEELKQDIQYSSRPDHTPHIGSYRLKKQKQKRLRASHCSVCARYIWFDSICVQEPEGLLMPPLSWTLCKECHGDLLGVLWSTPRRSPWHLRMIMYQIHLQYSPPIHSASKSAYIRNHRGIILIVLGASIILSLQITFMVTIASIK